MAHINLLPWRQDQRKERQRQFLTMLGLSAALMALIIFAVHLQYGRMISTQNSRNAMLQRHITEVEAQLKEIQNLEKEKERLLARMKVIQELQLNRPEIVRVFDEIVRTVPDGVVLSNMQQAGRSLTLKGDAQSNARVSSFMRNLNGSSSFSNPLLEVIEVDPKSPEKARKFSLRATQVTPEPVTEKK